MRVVHHIIIITSNQRLFLAANINVNQIFIRRPNVKLEKIHTVNAIRV